jgi:protein phosphatase
MLVADGMGGAVGGEIASREAIRSLLGLALETPDWIMRLDEASLAEVLRRFGQRFRRVREILVERAATDASLRGMGDDDDGRMQPSEPTSSSLTSAIRAPTCFGRASSRSSLAIIRSPRRWPTPARSDLRTSPRIRWRTTLTNALGTHEGDLRVELHHLRLEDGDQVLISSDGLTDMVDNATIVGRSEMRRRPRMRAGCSSTRPSPRAAGTNVTVVLGRYRMAPAAH